MHTKKLWISEFFCRHLREEGKVARQEIHPVKKKAKSKSFHEFPTIFLLILSPQVVFVSFAHTQLLRFCLFSQLSLLPAPNIRFLLSLNVQWKWERNVAASSLSSPSGVCSWECTGSTLTMTQSTAWRVRDFTKVCFNPQEPTIQSCPFMWGGGQASAARISTMALLVLRVESSDCIRTQYFDVGGNMIWLRGLSESWPGPSLKCSFWWD